MPPLESQKGDKPDVTLQYSEQSDLPPANPVPIEDIDGMVPTVAATPTYNARKFAEQFRIMSGQLCFYDQTNHEWTCVGGGIYHGVVINSSSAGTPFPTGWSVANNATGECTITHNLGTTNYTFVCVSKGTASIMSPQAQGSNTIKVLSFSTAAAAQSTDFFFILILGA